VIFEPVSADGDAVHVWPAAELTPEAVAAIAEQVRVRGPRWFARSGMIEPEDVREMLAQEHSGFSLDAGVRIPAHGRAGLERLNHFYFLPFNVRIWTPPRLQAHRSLAGRFDCARISGL
jgi:hypothetical protein